MAELVSENWIVLVLALLIGVAVAWWIFVGGRKATVTRAERPEGEAPGAAKRNQALIDAPPASAAPAPAPRMPEDLAGSGSAAAVAITEAPGATSGEGDDLTRIKGVGPKVAAILRGLGVTSFAQIAAWDEAEIDRIDARLGGFSGRIRRDDWRAQARLLASGDTAAYEAKFGRL